MPKNEKRNRQEGEIMYLIALLALFQRELSQYRDVGDRQAIASITKSVGEKMDKKTGYNDVRQIRRQYRRT